MAWTQGAYAAARQYYEPALTIQREIGARRSEGVMLINMANVLVDQGVYRPAKQYYEQALVIQREIGDRWSEGISLNGLGMVALAQAELDLAETYYQQALANRQDLNLSHYLVEDWAGLAQIRLAQGDQGSAHRYGQQIIAHLKETPRLMGAENPMRVFHFTWEVFVTLGQNIAAEEVLTQAAQMMQDYLDRNNDPVLQEMYLAQPHHRVLWAAWVDRTREIQH